MLKLYGAGPSPFVRKVRVVLAEKNLSYEHDPVVPFGVSDEFKKLSPLGKIPAIEDDGRSLCDSSVICNYLERKHPEPAMYPKDAYECGRSMWFEELGDTKLVEIIGPNVFAQRIIQPLFFQQKTDESIVQKAMTELLPPWLDYLEKEIPGEFVVGGKLSIGDIGIASPFVNLMHAGEKIDASRWPKLARYVDGIHSRPSFAKLIEEEKAFFGAAK